MYLYGHEELYIYALSLVKELGGQRFSVGSDGHKLEHFRLGFDQIQKILEAFEIGEDELIWHLLDLPKLIKKTKYEIGHSKKCQYT